MNEIFFVFMKVKSFLLFLLSGLFLAAMVLGLRGIYFITMKASHVDGPV